MIDGSVAISVQLNLQHVNKSIFIQLCPIFDTSVLNHCQRLVLDLTLPVRDCKYRVSFYSRLPVGERNCEKLPVRKL